MIESKEQLEQETGYAIQQSTIKTIIGDYLGLKFIHPQIGDGPYIEIEAFLMDVSENPWEQVAKRARKLIRQFESGARA